MGCYHEGADAPRQRFDRSLVLILFNCIASRWRLSLASGRVEEASWREDIVSCLCQSVHVATAGGDPRPGAPSFFGRDTPTRDCCYERCCDGDRWVIVVSVSSGYLLTCTRYIVRKWVSEGCLCKAHEMGASYSSCVLQVQVISQLAGELLEGPVEPSSSLSPNSDLGLARPLKFARSLLELSTERRRVLGTFRCVGTCIMYVHVGK